MLALIVKKSNTFVYCIARFLQGSDLLIVVGLPPCFALGPVKLVVITTVRRGPGAVPVTFFTFVVPKTSFLYMKLGSGLGLGLGFGFVKYTYTRTYVHTHTNTSHP